MSFYLDRFKRSYKETTRGKGDYTHYASWVGNRKLTSYHKISYTKPTYHEETYKDFSLIIVEAPVQITSLLDPSGTPVAGYAQVESSIEGESETTIDYFAFAWRIGKSDEVRNLRWCDDLADLKGVCMTRSKEKTIKMAKAKLDVYDRMYAVADQLSEMANNCPSNTPNVINALVGDRVGLWAWGRMREGIVVGTTGSRFQIAYVTPSSPKELKLKLLPLHYIYQGVPTP